MKGYVLLFSLASYPMNSAGAIGFSQCFSDVQACAQNSTNCTLGISNTTALSALRTSQGDNVGSADAATALSYAACTGYCGASQEEFSWTDFAQDYAAWLLPYLALVSQLPFGAPRRTDNLMSAFLTLGSPALAGYSLYMTLLNARWVNDQLFAGIDYPSVAVRRSVVRVLSSLQQVPLRIHPGESGRFESLVVHPDNDIWWTVLAEELGDLRKWSIATATSITWVVIAYLLTVADSIYNDPANKDSNGQGTGSGLLWLLPIVVGWLVLSPKCDYKRVHDAYHKASRQVVVANPDDPRATPFHVTSNFGLTISADPYWQPSGVTSPDELRIPPVFNYARVFSFCQQAYRTSQFYRAACQKSRNRIGVTNERIPGNVWNDVPRESRLGTREQIIRYCRSDDREYPTANVLWPPGLISNMIVASLMSLQLQWGTTGAAFLVVWFTPTTRLGCRSLAYLIYGVVSTVVWLLLVLSSALGYYAHHLLDEQSTLDLEGGNGCASPGPSTPSKPMLHLPTASLAENAPGVSAKYNSDPALPLREIHSPNTPREKARNASFDAASDARTSIATIKRRRTRSIHVQVMLQTADLLRWIGKSLAIVNAIGIIANSVFQYAGVYTNCYCDSSVFSWGTSAFNVIAPNATDTSLVQRAGIGGLALALCCCSFFVGTIYLVRDSLPS